MASFWETVSTVVHETDTGSSWPEAFWSIVSADEGALPGDVVVFHNAVVEDGLDRAGCLRKFLVNHHEYRPICYIEETSSVAFEKRAISGRWANRMDMQVDLFKPGSVGAEIGVCMGENSRFVDQHCRPSKFYLVDIWDGGIVNYHEMDVMISKYMPVELKDSVQLAGEMEQFVRDVFSDSDAVEVLRGDANFLADTVGPDSLDWVYIDGDHSGEAVAKDLETAYPLVRSGGVIAGHDYTLYRNCHGLVHAVDEFSDRMWCPFIGITREKVTPSFAMRKP